MPTPDAPRIAWRVFPWNPGAPAGEPFSPDWVPPAQGQGRFDLPGTPGGVIYVAETQVHAIAEMIQHYRGQHLEDADLTFAGHPFAIARAVIAKGVSDGLADLCDPTLLAELGIRPDETASADRRATQGIAARIHGLGYHGLRWWSAFRGEWHTLVLFRSRLEDGLRFEPPEPLSLSHAAVIQSMRELGVVRSVPDSR